jgi:hypothetical protein
MSALAIVAPKLSKLIPLLGSDQPGEVVAAATAIHGLLKKAGCDFHDLVAIIEKPSPAARSRTDFHEPDRPEIHVMAEFCCRHMAILKDKERLFVQQMQRNAALGWRISERQEKWLADIYTKLRRFS